MEAPSAPDNPFDDPSSDVEGDYESKISFEDDIPYEEPSRAATQRLGNDVAYEPEPTPPPAPAPTYEPAAAVSFESPQPDASVFENSAFEAPFQAANGTHRAAETMPPPVFETAPEPSAADGPGVRTSPQIAVNTLTRASSDGQPLSARIEHDAPSPESSRR